MTLAQLLPSNISSNTNKHDNSNTSSNYSNATNYGNSDTGNPSNNKCN